MLRSHFDAMTLMQSKDLFLGDLFGESQCLKIAKKCPIIIYHAKNNVIWIEPFKKNLSKLIEMDIYPISTMDLVDMM